MQGCDDPLGVATADAWPFIERSLYLNAPTNSHLSSERSLYNHWIDRMARKAGHVGSSPGLMDRGKMGGEKMSERKGHTTEDLCRSMLERHADVISVQKPEIAVKKLKLIISAALKLSNRKGFQAMSLRDLSKESGVSMGGLYAYFDSKTTLLNMILTEVTDAVAGVLGNPPPEVTPDPVEHLKWMIAAHIRLSEDMLPWFSFAFMEAKNFPARERGMAIDSEELTESFFAAVTDRAIAQGLFRAGVTPLLPTMIKPLLQDWYVKRAKYRRRGVTVEDYIRAVQEMVLATCLPLDRIADATPRSEAAPKD